MLDKSSRDDWISRRDERIRRPIPTLGHLTAEGVPYLSPEIQVFYKARGRRPKDEADFRVIAPILTDDQRQWLRDALTLAHGPDHPWLPAL
jgi:hypothetical protein